ncbi:amidohydrolase family protein [Planctomyces sp. SH-PL62]|uniref:amidohydrolase family protein n=1 Tax=Planctomyces sp. SH-PL62 TaxID=1636152 RepID=UPI00078CE5A7|nr:amidohydrolase family protein [Planctomyces sp. SH-PL62]AMV39303.1 imidazolonepropionase [Planctomyces sp. SH-PL62]
MSRPSPTIPHVRSRGAVRLAHLFALAAIVLSPHAIRAADDGAADFPAAYAVKGAKLFIAPGKVVDDGVLVVRDGLIEAAGPGSEVPIPFDAEVIEGKNLFVYPGFIDLYSTTGQKAGVERSTTGRGKPVDLSETTLAETPADNRKGLTPEFLVADGLELGEGVAAPRRRLGFTDLLTAPAGAIATGRSAFVSLTGLPRRDALLRSPVALHIQLAPPSDPASGAGQPSPGQRSRGGARDGGAENPFPRVLMGAVAHLRQAMSDAEHHQKMLAYEKDHGGAPVPDDPTLEVLAEARAKTLPVWWQAETRDEIHRALDLAREFGTSAVIVGGREAYKVVDRLKSEKVPVVLRLDFPEEPKVPTEDEFRKRPPAQRDEPLRVVAEFKGDWKSRVGTAALLAREGVPFALGTEGVDKLDNVPARLRALIAEGLTPDQALDALTRSAATLVGLDKRLGTLEPGKLAHIAIFSAPFQDEKAKVRYTFIDGRKFEVKADDQPGGRRGQPAPSGDRPAPDADKDEEAKEPKPQPPKADEEKDEPSKDEKAKDEKPNDEKKDEPPAPPFVDVATELDSDRRPQIKTGGDVLIKDAVILTGTKATIAKGSILIEKGKIKAIGPDATAAPGIAVIEAEGLVAVPGAIDTHSHIAVQGSVNEFSLSVVPDVRIKDVITGDDVSIYRALAGGTTTARVLHGSANTIGGQDAVIKLKYGLPGRELIQWDGPQGVKFALGENVTRSTGRFPNTRMGVESVISGAFEQALAYKRKWKDYNDKLAAGGPKVGPPPRRDFRLEALERMLDGTIKINSHCYRADEILMLLQTAERYGVRVQSLQHVLEGYKVAAEIAAHGAHASTFSDWWAYKIEAFDAIPFNAMLMSRAGVAVSIKSDSEELIRHLYHEAAKMVKYGGATEEQALAFVTINPALELGRENRIGSLEIGKDGDVALFNGHPFDAFARCEMTLIDGEVYFQRSPAKNGEAATRPGDPMKMPAAPEPPREPDLTITPQPKRSYALLGATLHPVSGPAIENGVLAIVDGKIAAIGPAGTPVPPEAQTIEIKGLDVWPGMIDAGTTVGLAEVGSLGETHDFADASRYQPELRAGTALKADSEHIPVTRANGVLAGLIEPSGGVISGQAALADFHGWVPREMAMVEAAALSVKIPRFNRRPVGSQSRQGSDDADPNAARKEQLESLKQEFLKARRYDEVVAEARAKGLSAPKVDPRLEALAPYAKGEKLVVFHADERVEILDALALIKELKLKAAISGAADAWKATREIKESGVPVLVAGTLNVPSRDYDPYDAAYANPARLHAAGIAFAIRSAPGASSPRNSRLLPYEAATAAAFGLPEDEALKAVTLAPAQILGVADQLGSLETGKSANVVVTAGHLLQPTTSVRLLFINGDPVTPDSRHTELYEKYSRHLEEVRSGRSPMGLERPPAARVVPDRAAGAP